MSIQQWGGVSSLIAAFTYIFGFTLFFGVLDASSYNTPTLYLEFVILNRDIFIWGYFITGIVFSLVLIVLVQALYQRFMSISPELMKVAAVLGYLWVFMLMSSSFIFLSSIEALVKYHQIDPEQALTINRAVHIVIDALGGGVELIGALWVLAVSFIGIRGRLYTIWVHYWGIIVGLAGMLTLFSVLSVFAENRFFELTNAIFGLGQIIWFIVLGWYMLKSAQSYDEVHRSSSMKSTVNRSTTDPSME